MGWGEEEEEGYREEVEETEKNREALVKAVKIASATIIGKMVFDMIRSYRKVIERKNKKI